MRILIDVTHPAYVHFFRAIIPALRKRGHELRITSRQKDVTIELLDAYGIEHTCLSKAGRSRMGLFCEMILRDYRLFREIRKFKPDVVLGRDGLFACQAAWFARVPSLSFDDTDEAKLQHRLYFPFASRVYTDKSYRLRIGKKQRFYRGVSPVAYLHPDVFKPDEAILKKAGLHLNKRLILVRLVSWTASHDYGEHGFDRRHLLGLIEKLEAYGRIIITSESPLPPELESRRVTVPVEKMHDLMSFISLYIGESATMASECAVLGKPAVYVSTLSTWYTQALEQSYGLIRHVNGAEECLLAAKEILEMPDFEAVYAHRRDVYLSEADVLHRVVLKALDDIYSMKSRKSAAR